jgi:hypothetical protein
MQRSLAGTNLSELERARVHYGGLQENARLAAARSLRHTGIDLRITTWSNKSERELAAQWPADLRGVDWDWPEKMRRHTSPKDFKMVFWTPEDRLVGLSIATLSNDKYAVARFIEGDPRPCCPYRGKRVLFALEAISNYVQGAGREEIRIHPLNAALASLYQDVYGFTLVTPHKQEPYYSKRV